MGEVPWLEAVPGLSPAVSAELPVAPGLWTGFFFFLPTFFFPTAVPGLSPGVCGLPAYAEPAVLPVLPVLAMTESAE